MDRTEGRWWAPIRFGQVPVAVCADGSPPGWPAGCAAQLCASRDPRPGDARAGGWPLAPLPGAERAYAVLAAALAAGGMTGVLQLDGGGGRELHLVSRGPALAVALTVPDDGDAGDPPPPPDEELALALTLLRTLPRRLSPARAHAVDTPGALAPVLDLARARAGRRCAS